MMEETATAMERVTDGARDVSETADEIRRMTERFRLDRDDLPALRG